MIDAIDIALNIVMFTATVSLLLYAISKGMDDFEIIVTHIYLYSTILYFIKRFLMIGEE